jgi:hypothetical protein
MLHSSKSIVPGSIHWKSVLSPWFVGSAMGLMVGFTIFGGGFDAFLVFLTDTLRTVPPTVHLLLKPIAIFNWPYSYALLILLTALSVRFVKLYFRGRWWLALFSAPVIWEIWSGQIEWMIAVGIVLAFLVLEKRISPYWLGLAWVLMISKPWIGIFPLFVLTLMIFQQFRWKPLIQASAVAAGLVFLTFLYKPDWYLTGAVLAPFSLAKFHTNMQSNGALFPWGIMAWVLVPGAKNRTAYLNRIMAAGLLSMPYFHLYHAAALVLTTGNRRSEYVMFVTGWAIVATGFFGVTWSNLSWIFPLVFLMSEKAMELVQPFIALLQRMGNQGSGISKM